MATVNQNAERIVKGMKRNQHRFRKLYGDRAKEVMYATANKLAQKEQVKMGPTFSEVILGEACEQRYCRLCKKKETRKQCSFGPAMWDKYAVKDATNDEVKKAAEDSGIVEGGEGVSEGTKSGDSSLHDWFSKSKSSDGKPGWVQLGGKYAGKPCAKQPGQTTKPKCGSSKMKRNLNKDEEERAFRRKNRKDPNPDRKGKAINVKTEETINERGDFWHPDPDKDRKLGGPGANQRAREDRAAASKPKSDPKKLRSGESYMDYAKRQKGYTPTKKKEGIRDKIKRKLGLKKEDCWDGYEKKGMKTMFGKKYPNCVKKTKTKKEEFEVQEGMGDVAIKAIRATQGKKPKELSKRTAMIRKIKMKQLDSYLKSRDKKKASVGEETIIEKEGKKDACYHKVKSRYSVWPSAYASGALVKCRKKGAKNWGNKSEGVAFQEFQEKAKACWDTHKKVGMKMKGGKLVNDCRPKNEEVTNEGAAWTKKSGKSESGGLNEKGRKSYERENPGSDLKAPSKKVGNPRRASFCARMRGMKKKLTSKKTASDPDSRINKSLRAWNC